MKNRFVILYDEEPTETQRETDSDILEEINNNLVRLNENLEQGSTEEALTEEASTEEASTEEASTDGIIFFFNTSNSLSKSLIRLFKVIFSFSKNKFLFVVNSFCS